MTLVATCLVVSPAQPWSSSSARSSFRLTPTAGASISLFTSSARAAAASRLRSARTCEYTARHQSCPSINGIFLNPTNHVTVSAANSSTRPITAPYQQSIPQPDQSRQ
eukprot:1185732-Prorocentrum_minimum.AAC.1